jgi:hypothetical protein
MKTFKNLLLMIKCTFLVLLITLFLFVAKDDPSSKLINYLRAYRNTLTGKNRTKRKSFLSKGIRFFSSRVKLTRVAVSDYWARGKEGAFFNRDEMGKAGFNNFAVILMATPTPENSIIGILGTPPVMGLRWQWAKDFIDACAVSTWVTIDPIVITADRVLLSAFNTAIGENKKAKWVPLYASLQALLSDFQGIANLDKPNAIVILQSGNFKIKGMGGKKPQTFQLMDGAVSGTVNLIGPAGPRKKKHLHDWFISYDLGNTWERIQPTINAETSFDGLPVGKVIWFAHQIIDANGVIAGSYDKKSIVVK